MFSFKGVCIGANTIITSQFDLTLVVEVFFLFWGRGVGGGSCNLEQELEHFANLSKPQYLQELGNSTTFIGITSASGVLLRHGDVRCKENPGSRFSSTPSPMHCDIFLNFFFKIHCRVCEFSVALQRMSRQFSPALRGTPPKNPSPNLQVWSGVHGHNMLLLQV